MQQAGRGLVLSEDARIIHFLESKSIGSSLLELRLETGGDPELRAVTAPAVPLRREADPVVAHPAEALRGLAMKRGEHASHRRPVGSAAELQALHFDERLSVAYAVIEGLGGAHARSAQRAQALGLRRVHRNAAPRALLDVLAAGHTPVRRRFAIDRRSTRISINARSNLWRQE